MSIAERYHLEIAQTSLRKDKLKTKVITALIDQRVLPVKQVSLTRSRAYMCLLV